MSGGWGVGGGLEAAAEGKRREAPAPLRELQREILRPLRYARVNVARASREHVEEELRRATVSQKSCIVTLYRKFTRVMTSQKQNMYASW